MFFWGVIFCAPFFYQLSVGDTAVGASCSRARHSLFLPTFRTSKRSIKNKESGVVGANGHSPVQESGVNN